MNEINYKPIGIIHTPFTTLDNIPVQNAGAKGKIGEIEIFQELTEGLKDLEGFSHIILIYHFHLVKKSFNIVKPFLDDKEHGIFATRSPVRPNPIGITVVKLMQIVENLLIIENVDMIDNTPLLDIKPFIPTIDCFSDFSTGWITGKIQDFETKKSDNRFST